MRSKETATDYRYFPEPDLLPVLIDDEYIDAVRATMPELPSQKAARYIEQYKLSKVDAALLSSSLNLANYFEEVTAICGDAKPASNWIRVELLGLLNRDALDIADSPVKATQLGILIQRILDETISGKIGKQVFEALWLGKATEVDHYIQSTGLKQVSDSGELDAIVDKIIAENLGQVEQYRAGKTKLMGFFVGQVMKETQGKANPKQVNELVNSKLKG
jgi:aspartyl-tRNA(Asn)/glutamyl-tRNA(Gln) amidotransferase subunit B